MELVNAREAAAEQRRLKMAGKQGGEGGSEGVVTVGGMSVRDWRWWGCGMLIIAQTRSGSELKGRRSWAADEALWHMRQGWQCLVWALLGTGEAFMCLRTCAHTHAHARTHTHTSTPKKTRTHTQEQTCIHCMPRSELPRVRTWLWWCCRGGVAGGGGGGRAGGGTPAAVHSCLEAQARPQAWAKAPRQGQGARRRGGVSGFS